MNKGFRMIKKPLVRERSEVQIFSAAPFQKSSDPQCIMSHKKASSGVIARAERKCRVSAVTSMTQISLTCIFNKTPIECYIQIMNGFDNGRGKRGEGYSGCESTVHQEGLRRDRRIV